jgi:ribose transport system ATP-binding protein
MNPVLVTRSLSKSYGPTRALKSVDFTLRAGEVRALVGGNGSGKSTFIKILAGVEKPDRGASIKLPTGTETENGLTPQVARAEGLRFVHQDLALVDDLSVAENLALGDGYAKDRIGLISWKGVNARAAATIDRFDIGARPRDLMKTLPALVKTKVAVARALADINTDRPGVLVFDEPTTSMSNRESATFLDWLRGFSEAGHAIIFVSHRLDEVLTLAEAVTVLRDGAHVGTVASSGLEERALVAMMTGKELSAGAARADGRDGAARRLELRQLTAGPLHGLDLEVDCGEIVGIAGLAGSGRSTLLRAIVGDLAVSGGQMLLDGEPHSPRSVPGGLGAGLAYLPEDRLAEAAFPDLSVADNLMAGSEAALAPGGWLKVRQQRKEVVALIDDFRIRCGSPRHEMSTLSGGNQQKVVMARLLRRKPRLLLLDEPTQGVDVLARSDIHEAIKKSAATGMSVLVVTSDFNELARLADRVVILRGGKAADEMKRGELSEHSITERTYGSVGG